MSSVAYHLTGSLSTEWIHFDTCSFYILMSHVFKFLKIIVWHLKSFFFFFFLLHSLRINCWDFALFSIYCSCWLLFVYGLSPPVFPSSYTKRILRVYSCDIYLVTVIKVKLTVHTCTHVYTHAHTWAQTHTGWLAYLLYLHRKCKHNEQK